MFPSLRSETRRRGFTLVELLVVILIIGILAGLITTASIGALRAAHRMTVTGEISQMSMALERYKQERGDYPPDFAGIYVETNGAARDAVLQHLRQAFPRYRPGQYVTPPFDPPSSADTPWELFAHDVNCATRTKPNDENTGIKLGTDLDDIENIKRSERMTPAAAIVFWLGGVAVPGGSTTLRGFAANPMNPFDREGSRLDPYFDFNEDRLEGGFDEEGRNVFGETDVYVPHYYEPPHVRDPNGGPNAPPYVYFRARNGYNPQLQQFPWPGEGATAVTISWCLPYLKNYDPDSAANCRWFNPTTYQVLCSGLDGYYAEEEKDTDGNLIAWSDLLNPPPPGRQPPEMSLIRTLQIKGQAGSGNLAPEEDDNLTNFTKGGLGDWSEER